MSLGTFSSRILGFARDAILFAFFNRTVTDAFVVGFRLPNLFRRLFGEGSLAVSFIPVFVETQHKQDEERAKALSNATFSALWSLMSTFAIIGYIFMDKIVWFLVGNEGGYASVPGKIALTVFLAKIMVIYLILVTTYGFLTAISNALKHFFWPAVAPALFNVSIIVFALLPQTHVPGEMLAWGVVVGGAAQLCVVAFLLYRLGYLPIPTLKWSTPGFGTVIKNMIPGLFGLGIYQIMTLVNTKFAARLAEGAQSYIYAADRVIELPQSLIAISLGAALLPRYSEFLSRDQKEELLFEANSALRILLFLAVPCALGMFFLARPIVQVLFQRGDFHLADAVQTAQVVEIYSVLLLFSSISKVTVPAFYAMKNTTLPAVVAAIVLSVHLVLGSYLVNRFGLPGLASATACSGFLNMFILVVIFRWWLGPFGMKRIVNALTRQLPGALALSAICLWGHPWILHLAQGHLRPSAARVAALAIVIVASAIMYFFLGYRCGSVEAERLMGRFFGRLPKRFFFSGG